MKHPTTIQITALKSLILAMADDEWMMGDRGATWLALTPDLEEDLAMSSISQDEIGHAALLYTLLEELGEPGADTMVYERGPENWHHAVIAQHPTHSWAEWVVRRYCYEVFDDIRRKALARIPYPPLIASLKKMDAEESYHLLHFRSLMSMLARGGPLSRSYVDTAILADWPLLADLFEWGGRDEAWVLWDAGQLAPSAMRSAFDLVVQRDLIAWELEWPGPVRVADRAARHHDNSKTLPELLQHMREVRHIALAGNW